MNTLSTVARTIITGAGASAIAVAATLMPAAAANAAGVGSGLGGATVAPCAPTDFLCALGAPGSGSPIQNHLIWLGPANPSFQPLIGIQFPNIFGLNFEACLGGARFICRPTPEVSSASVSAAKSSVTND